MLAHFAASGGERSTDAAQAAVAPYQEQVAEGALQSDVLAWVSYALALERAGGPDTAAQAASALEAAGAVANGSREGGDGGGKAPAVAAMVTCVRCASTSCSRASGRRHTSGCGRQGGGESQGREVGEDAWVANRSMSCCHTAVCPAKQ